MNSRIALATLLASLLPVVVLTPAPAENYRQAAVNPAALAEGEIAAESRGDVAAALALYADDAIVQNGGLCWTPCVGKAAIRKELERRVAALNHPVVVAKFASGNVAVIKTEVRLGYTDKSGVRHTLQWSPGVDRIVVWNLYELKADKIAVVTLVGQRTDPQTARFIAWFRSSKK
jgi:ketosteroid isomerase-like protein